MNEVEESFNDKPEVISEAEKIQLMSEDVQEIFGAVPSWITRWGITTILAIVLLMLMASTVFRYPDIIQSTVVIVSRNPPAPLVARSTGNISHLLVHEGSVVSEGDVLAVIENTADYTHVGKMKEQLKKMISAIDKDSIAHIAIVETGLSLGTLQQHTSKFLKEFSEYQSFFHRGLIQKKIEAVNQRTIDYTRYKQKLEVQVRNSSQAIRISKQQFTRDSTLFTNGVLAPAEYERAKQTYLQNLNAHQTLMAAVVNAQMEIGAMKYQVADLESQLEDERKKLRAQFKQSAEELHAAIAEWEKSYLIISPIQGKVTLNKFWSENQFVAAGDVVLTVVPKTPQQIVARLKIPVTGSGKVKDGQPVHIRVANYPHTEFGMLVGKIEAISLIPEIIGDKSYYNAVMSLPQGLTTNYGRVIPFSQQLQGEADIVTNSMSLFSRFVNPLRSAWNTSLDTSKK
jgi:HlyD family secretion protein